MPRFLSPEELTIVKAKVKYYADKKYINDDGSYKVKWCNLCKEQVPEINFFPTVEDKCKSCLYRQHCAISKNRF